MTRPSTLALGLLLLGCAATAATFADAVRALVDARPKLAERAALVERLGLTDLALMTEARYTRHPTQADRHAPFQDHPFAFEHFPSGSLIGPPRYSRSQP